VEILKQVARQLDAGWAHFSSCLSAPLSAPACKSAWTWATMALVVIGLIILWKILVWLARPFRVWLEEMRMRARERKVADEETMAQYKVDDSKLFTDSIPENVEQRIRDALLEKKLTDRQQRHHQLTGDKNGTADKRG
jgi:flagellar biosynthesis/type III secretory pathway M-ring protein FliF/YscJ